MSGEDSKMSLKQLAGNCHYIVSYAFRISPAFYRVFTIAKLINSLISSVFSVLATKLLIDCVTNGGTFSQAVIILLVTTSIMLFTFLFDSFLETVFEIKNVKINGIIQRNVLKKASEMDIKYYDDAKYYNEFMRALERGENLIANSISAIINAISMIFGVVGIVGVVMTIDPVIALFPFLACIINIISLSYMQKIQYELSLKTDKHKRLRKYVSRVFYRPIYAKEMKLTNISVPLLKMFNHSIDEENVLIRTYGWKLMIATLLHYVFGWTIFAFYFPPLYMSYRTIVKKTMSIGGMSTVHSANLNAFYTLRNLATNIMEFHKIGLYAEKFRKFMEMEPVIEESEGVEIDKRIPQQVEVKHLSFKYDDELILDDINMTINPGEKIAIVGYNGAGKTTFIKLLLRLYDPSEGCICYGGKDIREYDIKEYREMIGVLRQDFQIYSCDVRQNVTMGYDAKDLQVEKALKEVGVDKKLALYQSLDTMLEREFDEKGIILSGGERQKIAMARLLVKDSSIYIMDEPSSALDPIAEYELNETMLNAAHDNTVILISHRLSTTRTADRIYLFKKGKIIEQGSHNELMALDREYASMFKKQAAYYVDL